MFRALVMLACLALVPLLGLYGKYLPDFAQSVVEAYKARTQGKAAEEKPGGEAPLFSGSARSSSSSRDESSRPAAAAPGRLHGADEPIPPLSELRQPKPFDPVAPGRSSKASFNEPISGGESRDPAFSVDPNAPTGPKPPAASDRAFNSGEGSAAADICTDQFPRMEKRLRELGATYYLLETWGSTGDRYRFFCKMAIAGNADYNRNRIFQATAADPLRAMQDVLAQVEQWRNGETQ